MATDFEICIDVECTECGSDLTVEYSEGTLRVEPCDECLDEKYKEGEESRDEVISDLNEKVLDLQSKLNTADIP